MRISVLVVEGGGKGTRERETRRGSRGMVADLMEALAGTVFLEKSK